MAVVEKLPVAPRMDYGVPEFKMIPLKELLIDRRYQRALDDKRVAKYADAHLSGPQFGALIVSRRKNGYAVLDGQHRLALLKVVDQGQLAPCLVYDVPSSEIEAALFVAIQEERKPVTPLQRHHAQLHRHEPTAVAIDLIASEIGFRITDSKVYGAIACVSTLRQIVAYPDGERLLHQTLSVIRDAWGLGEIDACSQTIVRGLSRFLRHASPKTRNDKLLHAAKVDISSLVSGLSKTPPQQIIRQARHMSRDYSGDMATLVAREIVTIYNKRRTKGRLDPSLQIYKETGA